MPAAGRRVPRRAAFLSPRTISHNAGASGLPTWSLFWADGKRNLAEIAALASWENTGSIGGDKRQRAPITLDQVADYFEAHEKMDYVKLIEPSELVSKAQLIADLKKLGLEPGMDVMVHSSLNAIGYVKGGADTVVDALLAVIGKRGTLMMPSFNHRAAQVYNLSLIHI